MQLPAGTLLWALIVILLGLVVGFVGYRLFKSAITQYRFVNGAGIGIALANRLAEGNTLLLVIAALILGLIGAALIHFLYWVGVFAIGAVAGAVLAETVLAAFGQDAPLLLVIVVAIVVGIIALTLQRVVIVLATAFSGAWAVVSGVAALIRGQPVTLTGAFTPPDVGRLDTLSVVVLVAWLVLAIAGAVYQFRTTAEPAAATA